MKTKLAVLGMVCPFPLIEAKEAIQSLNSGDELVIDFDCTQATESIPRWAAEAGHTITNYEQIDDASWTITVRKNNWEHRRTVAESFTMPLHAAN
ncbi:oxidoreductase [Paenibacillus sp. E194]|nr:oxidoreductase [Paenibacillus sp. E194]